MKDNKWARLLAYVTGLVNQKLLLQNEYLIAENRILRAHLPQRLRLTDPRPRWPRSASASAVKRSRKLPSSSSRKLFSPGRATLGVEHEVKTLQILKQPYGYFLVRHGGDEHSFPPGPLTLDKASFVAYLSIPVSSNELRAVDATLPFRVRSGLPY